MVIGLLAFLLPALYFGFVTAKDGAAQQLKRLAATGLVKEAEDAARNVDDRDWNSFAVDGTYHPVISGSIWTLVSGAETLSNGFSRQIIIGDVYRNASGTIVTTPGTLDLSTKRVDVTVSWSIPFNSSITSTLYLTRHKNLTFTQTTGADFNAGISTPTNTTVIATNGTGIPNDGQVQLAANSSGKGDWCQPNLNINNYPIPNNGVGIAVSAVPNTTSGQPNYAYISTGQNSASFSLSKLSITDPSTGSPAASLSSTYNNGKDYGVFANSSYIFVAATNVPKIQTVVDIINASTFTEAGYFDTGSKAAYSTYVSGNTGYVTADTNLIAFDVSTINGMSQSQSQLWSKSLNSSATGNKVVVSGNYAYIATSATGSSQQLQVVDLVNSSHQIYSPPGSGSGAINTNQPGIDVAVLGNYVFLVTSYTSGSPDVFVIDISHPTTPTVIGTATTTGNMSPTGVATTFDNVIIVVGNGGDQYQVFNVTTPSSPFQCGKLTNPNNATNVCAVTTLREADTDSYSYILTTQGQCRLGSGATQEFQMIAGGPIGGGGLYVSSGAFTSSSFHTKSSTAFNSFSATVNQPSNTSIKLQVASANDNGTDCTGVSYTYLGPNGDPSQYFTVGTNPSIIANFIPYTTNGSYVNPGKCFSYKASLSTTNTNATPVLYDMTVNYSP